MNSRVAQVNSRKPKEIGPDTEATAMEKCELAHQINRICPTHWSVQPRYSQNLEKCKVWYKGDPYAQQRNLAMLFPAYHVCDAKSKLANTLYTWQSIVIMV